MLLIMRILNFAHPLSNTQLVEIETLTRTKITKTINISSQINPELPIEPQIETMLDRANLKPIKWQTLPLIINLPSLNFSAAALLAQVHGRTGYFPAVLRLRPVAGALPPHFAVAEIINLQAMRERAREKRQ
jgi:hypothetical protein